MLQGFLLETQHISHSGVTHLISVSGLLINTFALNFTSAGSTSNIFSFKTPVLLSVGGV